MPISHKWEELFGLVPEGLVSISLHCRLSTQNKCHLFSSSAVPDNLVLRLLTERLNALDCLTNGWVLSGFPRDVGQGEQLQKAQINPNR